MNIHMYTFLTPPQATGDTFPQRQETTSTKVGREHTYTSTEEGVEKTALCTPFPIIHMQFKLPRLLTLDMEITFRLPSCLLS